ncbi:hypothetical protein CPB84DRAFT_1748976 [Gymnopilus junonius]|uniref:G domain-containing protein n=1 Tax=Gymnopilus junonius TaxID=109634 RepID=A0A9P5NH51_GYMJU|nr:hypothetical protein CPB84DRAFT_1748976 [Gymnopilus junonius]
MFQMKYRQPRSSETSDLLIVVVGPVGSGKSRNSSMVVSEGLSDGTKAIQVTEISNDPIKGYPGIRGRRLLIADTPGLDGVSGPRTTMEIADYLKDLVIGFIYLHDISNDRLSNAALHDFRFLQQYCGCKIGETIIGTMKWDRISHEDGQYHGKQLNEGHLKPLVTKGSMVRKYENTPHSAWDIVDMVSVKKVIVIPVMGATGAGKSSIVTGVIYLHNIANNRFSGSARRNLGILQRLCGDDALKKVVLGTTMWDTSATKSECEAYEQEMKNDYWQPLIEKGSMVKRFTYNQASAWEIVNALLEPLKEREFRGELEQALQIQKELVDDHKLLLQTEAGKMVLSNLKKSITKQEDLLRRARQGEKADLKREMDSLQKQLQAMTKDLKVPLPSELRTFLGH